MGDERVTVKTYVPAHQRETWRDHADRMGMSLSEFVRTMTQAGRRGFEVEPAPRAAEPADPEAVEENPGEGGSSDADPRGDGLEDLILRVLREDGPASWDRLLDEATGEVEERLDDTLTRLQSEGRLRYSGRDGGYTLAD